jgi:hypothetical protein
LLYRPASLCSLATKFQTRFLESIPRPMAGLKFSTLISILSCPCLGMHWNSESAFPYQAYHAFPGVPTTPVLSCPVLSYYALSFQFCSPFSGLSCPFPACLPFFPVLPCQTLSTLPCMPYPFLPSCFSFPTLHALPTLSYIKYKKKREKKKSPLNPVLNRHARYTCSPVHPFTALPFLPLPVLFLSFPSLPVPTLTFLSLLFFSLSFPSLPTHIQTLGLIALATFGPDPGF